MLSLVLLLSMHPATAADDKTLCSGKTTAKELNTCLSENYPKTFEKVKEACGGESAGADRWDCKKEEYAKRGIAIVVPTMRAALISPTRPDAKEASSEGTLTWTYFNLPPWSGDTAPSTSGVKPAKTEHALYLERDIDSGAPCTAGSADWFVAAAAGQIHIETAGTYLFSLKSENVVGSVTVGSGVLSRPAKGVITTVETSIYFDKPGWYPLDIVLANAEGNVSWALKWRRPGDNETQSIPAASVRETP